MSKKDNPAGGWGKKNVPVDSNTNSAASQRGRIMTWLREMPLSTLQARKYLDVLHPAARIQELKEAGHNIITYWHIEESAPGRRHRVGLYVLLADGEGAKDA